MYPEPDVNYSRVSLKSPEVNKHGFIWRSKHGLIWRSSVIFLTPFVLVNELQRSIGVVGLKNMLDVDVHNSILNSNK